MGEYKNTIIAIVLSLVVVIGWQYFIGYPQMQRQQEQAQLKKQEQAQVQPGQTQPNTMRAAEPVHGQRPAGAECAHHRAAGRQPGSGDRRLPARRHRHAAAPRQHRSQGRPHRRSVAHAIPRRRRSELAADRAVLAVGRAGRLLRRIRLGAGRRHHRGHAGPRHGVEAGRLRHARRRSSGHAVLRQWPGPRLHPHHRGRRPLSVHHQGPGRQQRQRAGHAVSLWADLAPRHAAGARLLHSA